MLQPKNSLTLAPKWVAYAFSAAALIVLWQSTALGNLLGGDEPLSPEVAFVPSFVETTSNHISVKFDIEDGYYLYRDKLKFNVESDQSGSQSLNNILASTPIELSTPNFPPAKILDDQFFGEMAIYRNQVRIDIPYTQFSSVDSGMLEITYQGCADIGLCYPPTKAKVSFDPPPSKASGDAPIILAELNTLGGVGAEQPSSLASPISGNDSGFNIFGESSAQDELLPPELAYLPQIVSATGSNIVVRWFIEPGYYLYRDKLSFSLEQLPDVSLVHVQLDEGVDQYDEFYGDVKVFRHSADAVLTIDSSRSTSGKLDGQLLINYQGCADIGVCFPPSVTELPVNFEATESNRNSDPVIATLGTSGSTSGTQGGNAALVASIGNNASAASNTGGVLANAQTPQQTAPIAESEQDRLFNFLSSSGLWLTVATFFGFGLLLAFTPCVLPMVPILSSLIVGQGDKMSTMRAFQLSLIYVLVMASTYALVGIIVGLSGYNVQAFLQNPWVLSFIAVLFVLLSLSMFGFYELQMPVSLQEKLTKWSNKQVGGQVSGVAAMGFISTLIVGPCITAPLAGALIYIAKTGDAVIGGAALFALGLGMGAPLLLIGTSAGKFVPKAGTWMDAVKHVFGIIMIAMAIYMISRFIPTTVTMLLFGVLAVMSGIYWGAADSVTKESTGWQKFAKGTGLVVSLYGAALLVGALSGGGSYLTPLKGLQGGGSGAAVDDQHLAFAPVKSIEELNQIVSRASAEGRPVMLDFYADWCVSCKEMEAFTFTDARVQAQLKNTVVIQADVTANDNLDKALLKHFDLFGPPGIIFYDTNGYEIRSARVVGFMSADKFSTHVSQHIGSNSI